MKKCVYLLQHSYSYGKHLEYEETKIIGIYSLREEAVAIIEKYKLYVYNIRINTYKDSEFVSKKIKIILFKS